MGLFNKKPAKKINVPELADNIISSPLSGTVVQLSEVPDETFATGIVGDGIAVDPTEGALYAPADGTIVSVFETLHAIGMATTGGAEVLMHVGIDTVNLGGAGFTAYCKAGDQVKRGDLLLTFDKKELNKKGYLTITPVCIGNSALFQMKCAEAGTIEAGQPLIELLK
jgi:PTS system beta-glucosides-specific IIC component